MISIVIPVYNASAFIVPCLDSIIRQTYQNLEVILVDDGSKDDSLKVCQAYGEKYPNIRVIHQENQGVSAARNCGLSYVTGAYVSFIDADDYITPDYFEVLYKDLVDNDADMVCCDFFEILNGEVVHICPPRVTQKRLVTQQEQLFRDMALGQEDYACCVWGKLIKTEFAKQCSFKPLRFGEDQVYMYDVLLLNPKTYLDDYKGYYYIRNESSATMAVARYSVSRCRDDVAMRKYKFENLPDTARELKPAFCKQYVKHVIELARAAAMAPEKETRKRTRKIVNDTIDQAMPYMQMLSASMKVRLLAYRYAPELYRKLVLARAKNQA